MVLSHKQFIKIINAYKTSTISADIKWKDSEHDLEYFDTCVAKLLNLGVSSVMDLACGEAQFLKKTMERGISSVGIEPRIVFCSLFLSLVRHTFIWLFNESFFD